LPEYLFFANESAGHPLTIRLIDAVEKAGGEAIETDRDILTKLSGKDNPQTVIGVYREFETSLDRIDRNAANIWLVAQSLRDPGNLGTILRTGDAVGAGGLILVDDCVDPFSVEAVRATMGALFTQRIVMAKWPEFLGWLRSGPGQLVGTSLKATHDYLEPAYAVPTFILIGNEARGLPADYEADCDLLVKIPMLGRADSLNAAIATAVIAYEVLNQRRRA
jgi:TrmH family RNA methyltransferase